MADDPTALVPLTTAANQLEAELLADTLRADGVHAEVFGAAATQLQYGLMTANVTVSVPRADLERASAILEDFRSARAKDGEASPTLTPETAFASDLLCAGCGYSLAGLGMKTHCPECGRTIPDRQRALLGTTPKPVHAGADRAARSFHLRRRVARLAGITLALTILTSIIAILAGVWIPAAVSFAAFIPTALAYAVVETKASRGS